MPRAIIFANGELNPPLPDPTSFKPEELTIAADGGAIHCSMLGITPRILIGDLDSLTSDQVDEYKNLGVQLLRYPTRKDETDLELAILHAVHRGYDHIIVYGALGARWDMTLANLLLLTHPSFTHTRLDLIDGNQEISLVRGGERVQLHGKTGDIVSLIPLSAEASGIITHGLEYSLLDGTLPIGSPRGVSNIMLFNYCHITLKQGLLAIVHLRQELP